MTDTLSGQTMPPYAEVWADSITETYADPEACGCCYLHPEDFHDGESCDEAETRVLMKAAECLRNGVPVTLTAGELDLIRHLMPAHEVHQSGSVRWVRERAAILGVVDA